MAELRDLGGAAVRLLKLFVDGLERLDVDVPEARVVAPGQLLAWDGEMLAVTIRSVEQGQPGSPQAGTMFRGTYFVTFGVSLIRSVPALYGDGQPGPAMIPSVEDVTAAGVSGFDDAAAMVLVATSIREEYLMADPGDGFGVGPLQPAGPSGGLAGYTIDVSISAS